MRNKFDIQLHTFLRILKAYESKGSLSIFLASYFKANKQMGSGDRRTATHLLYTFFRLGKACIDLPSEERLFIAEYLCSSKPSGFLEYFRPALAIHVSEPLVYKFQRLRVLYPEFDLKHVFPFSAYLSARIEPESFFQSVFIQPDLFIHIRKGRELYIKQMLKDNNIDFYDIDSTVAGMPNSTKLDSILKGREDAYRVQDVSSQETGKYFKPVQGDSWWDCCAASGGKSLLLLDEQSDIDLVVSDSREKSLFNLDKRLRSAGYTNYSKHVLDLTKQLPDSLGKKTFDGIILDAPCTGSGTWGRSPELISQFQESQIQTFQSLQRTIAQNVVRLLKPGKPLVYITCSVFEKENEENTRFFTEHLGLKLEDQNILEGYTRKADTMYVARLIKL